MSEEINNINENKKDFSLSAIRCISMLLIISCHILQGLGYSEAFWVNIGVQIFFFMSGFLYGKKDIDNIHDFYKGRVEKILIPYIILVIIMYITEKYILGANYSKMFLLGNILGLGGYNGTLKTISHTWFISYILACYLITPILQLIFKNDKNKLKKLILLIILLQVLQIYNAINIVVPWIVNYIIGYYYSKCCKTKRSKRIYNICIYILTILILPLHIILQENLNVELPMIIKDYGLLICNWGHVLLGSSIFIILYKLFNILKIKNNFILKFSDKYSFFVYLVHQIFILENFSMLHITKNMFYNIALIMLVSILSGIVLYYIYVLIIKCIKFFENTLLKAKRNRLIF